ncbi:hypothetical protein NM688_g1374 [Phlebia brevispora]|uniref:Uncharacterized protein n=1 Tax=Phlebia brevispora TaxID=194682 RepID=A0ACC1TC04_9APHY|nr:hypothetical protein NM688_g1374 [Phlebia brevispora]
MTTYPVTESQPLKSTNPFRPAPMTPEEISKVEQIVDITCCPKEDALKHLRRKGGNVEQALDAIFNGESADEVPKSSAGDMESLRAAAAGVVTTGAPLLRDIFRPADSPRVSKSEKPSPPMIDLTGDDDEEMSRALRASLEDQGPVFRPSDRAPNPDWAMVPSNVEVHQDPVSQEDQQMNQAIEASLQFVVNDEYDEPLLEDRVRKGHCPVALRPTNAAYCYAGLLLHALFFVPQVRYRVSRWRPQPEDYVEQDPQMVGPPTSGPGFILWSLLELFVNMDLARMSELNVDKCLDAFETVAWNISSSEGPGEISCDCYNKLTSTLELELHEPVLAEAEYTDLPRIFYFQYNYSDTEITSFGDLDPRFDMAVVKVDIRGTPDANDLLSCLSQELFPERYQRQQVIFKSSEIVAFQLMRHYTTNGERELFSFPPHLYLDQFLRENVELANEKRRRQWELNAQVDKLNQRKAELTRDQDRDVLADLRSSIFYYENIAESDNEERKAELKDTLTRLKQILTDIEAELQEIETTVSASRAEAAIVFDCPELQKSKYDLRAVLVHDGLAGRTRLYSYVKYKGVWWKTVDSLVTEVSEDVVLNDAAGLHLRAGPYFLIYSAALSEEEENMPMAWPDLLKDSVKHNNHLFFRELSEEKRATVEDPNSPPTLPFVPVPPVDVDIEEVSTLDSEPLLRPASAERMDID